MSVVFRGLVAGICVLLLSLVVHAQSPSYAPPAPTQNSPRTALFVKPLILSSKDQRKYRLDWCKQIGSSCGESPAMAFCKEIDPSFRAVEWQIDEGIGEKEPTLTIDSRQLCTSALCDGYKKIECRAANTGADRLNLDTPAEKRAREEQKRQK